jgi:hypothetical protein
VLLVAVAGAVFWIARPGGQPEKVAAGESKPADNRPAEEVVPGPEEDREAGLRPPALTGEKVVRLLPSAVSDLAVGGGGRYLVLHLPALRKLAVFDVNEARVVKYLPLAEDQVKFAAGADKLIVLLPGGAKVQRWALGTWEREKEAALPGSGTVRYLSLGCAAHGPALMGWGGDQFGGGMECGLLDTATLRSRPLLLEQGPNHGVPGNFRHVRAAAGGQVFGVSFLHGQGGVVVPRPEGRTELTTLPTQPGAVLPVPDGSMLCARSGLFTRDGRPLGVVDQGDQSYRVPACHGHYYLHLEPADGRWVPTVYTVGDTRPILRLPQVEVSFGPEDAQSPGLANDKRILFIPGARLIVTVPPAGDRLVLHRFDVEEALEKSGLDYLLVTSRPPASVKKGTTYAHQLTVKSKRGGVKCRLESGPAGMRVTAGGQITWAVPADHAATEAEAVLSVRDRSGQELFRTIRIDVLP